MEKKIVLLAYALIIMAGCVFADKYKVLYVNSEDIRIGKKVVKVGQIFTDQEPIVWSSENQAFKAINLNTKRAMVFAAKSFKKKRAQSLYDYLTTNKRLSTRKWSNASEKPAIEEWKLDTTLYLMDVLYIQRPMNKDKNVKAKAVFCSDNHELPLSLSDDGRCYVIRREDFIGRKDNPLYIDILEYDMVMDWEYPTFLHLNIEVIPM